MIFGILAFASNVESEKIVPTKADEIREDKLYTTLIESLKPPNYKAIIGQHGTNIQLGYSIAYNRGIINQQWDCLFDLGMIESGWNHKAINLTSGAYGIPQSLPASKMLTHGEINNPVVQINWMIDYISERYKTPCNALSFHNQNNWY